MILKRYTLQHLELCIKTVMFILNKLFILWAEVVTQLRKHCQMLKHTRNVLITDVVNTAAVY
jgi:hypothetical protein